MWSNFYFDISAWGSKWTAWLSLWWVWIQSRRRRWEREIGYIWICVSVCVCKIQKIGSQNVFKSMTPEVDTGLLTGLLTSICDDKYDK